MQRDPGVRAKPGPAGVWSGRCPPYSADWPQVAGKKMGPPTREMGLAFQLQKLEILFSPTRDWEKRGLAASPSLPSP